MGSLHCIGLRKSSQPVISELSSWNVKKNLLDNVCSVCLRLLCGTLLTRLRALGHIIPHIKPWPFSAPRMCVFRIVRYVLLWHVWVVSLCDFISCCCKGEDDIKIQRRHIKWEITSWGGSFPQPDSSKKTWKQVILMMGVSCLCWWRKKIFTTKISYPFQELDICFLLESLLLESNLGFEKIEVMRNWSSNSSLKGHWTN